MNFGVVDALAPRHALEHAEQNSSVAVAGVVQQWLAGAATNGATEMPHLTHKSFLAAGASRAV